MWMASSTGRSARQRISPAQARGHSFDTIYDVSAYQPYNVSETGPGQPGYNGGRWRVQAVTFSDHAAALAVFDSNMSGDFDSAAEIRRRSVVATPQPSTGRHSSAR
jgi:hypothetical protein